MKVLKWLDKHFEEIFLVILLSMIVIVMLYQIIRRYVFNSSLEWSEEFCRYAFVWFIFLALPYSIRLGSELRMDAVINLLPKHGLCILRVALSGVCLAFAAYLFIQSIITFQGAVATGEISSGLHLPTQYVYLSMVPGFGLSVIRYIQQIYFMVLEIKNGGDGS